MLIYFVLLNMILTFDIVNRVLNMLIFAH